MSATLLDLMGEPPATEPIRYPDVPGSRGLQTSRLAADGIAPKVDHLRAKAFAILKTEGPHTADEAAEKLEASILAIRPRFTELKAKGMIFDTGKRRLVAVADLDAWVTARRDAATSAAVAK